MSFNSVVAQLDEQKRAMLVARRMGGEQRVPQKVQFPRFEYQDAEGELKQRASVRQWLSPGLVELINKPAAVAEEQVVNIGRETKWWGVYHSAKVLTTQALTSSAPAPGLLGMPVGFMPEQFRSQLYKHDYLWDQQAMNGNAWEVTLERSLNGEIWVDIMSIMGRIKNRQPAPGQQLVMRHGLDWVEPDTKHVEGYNPQNLVDFCLDMTVQLALSGAPTSEIISGP